VSRPYLTLDEFKNAPTALDYGNLVQGGTLAAQDAELSNAITRASSYIDQFCNQIIGATSDSEQQRTRVRPDGTIRFHPKFSPIVSLNTLSIGFTPNGYFDVPDPSQAWLEEQQVIFPLAGAQLSTSSQGPLSFGWPVSGRAECFIKYTYVNGYAQAVSTASASAGATSITVDNGLGIIAGESLKVYDGAFTENIIVGSSYVYGSTTVPLASPLLYAHTAGVSVSGLPAAVKQACILITSAYLKIRGDASLTLAVTTSPGMQVEGSQRVGSDIAQAQEILKPFRRIR
jgi:hypothetical protein